MEGKLHSVVPPEVRTWPHAPLTPFAHLGVSRDSGGIVVRMVSPETEMLDFRDPRSFGEKQSCSCSLCQGASKRFVGDVVIAVSATLSCIFSGLLCPVGTGC